MIIFTWLSQLVYNSFFLVKSCMHITNPDSAAMKDKVDLTWQQGAELRKLDLLWLAYWTLQMHGLNIRGYFVTRKGALFKPVAIWILVTSMYQAERSFPKQWKTLL